MCEDTLFFQRRMENAFPPTRATSGSAGFDLKAPEDFMVPAQSWKMVSTGLSFEIPTGTYGRVAGHSSLASVNGIFIIGGVVDSDYRGCVGVILVNFSSEPFHVKTGDKIAQLIIKKCCYPRLAELQNMCDATLDLLTNFLPRSEASQKPNVEMVDLGHQESDE